MIAYAARPERAGRKCNFKPKLCAECRQTYKPTGPKQYRCNNCALPSSEKSKRYRAKAKLRTFSTALDQTPLDVGDIPGWVKTAPFREVDSAWVALMVEQFGTDDNRAALALALVAIRDRYRRDCGTTHESAV